MSKKKKKQMTALFPKADGQALTSSDGRSAKVLIYVRKMYEGKDPAIQFPRKYNPVTRRHERFAEKKISKS